MADNYLENKFEEYQQRKFNKTNSSSKRNKIQHCTRRVLITEGAEGLGKALVKMFRSVGHRVAFFDNNDISGKDTALKTGTTFIHTDIKDKNNIEQCMNQLFDNWGDIDIIINNAEIKKIKPITSMNIEEFDDILSVNLRPIFITARQLAIHRKKLALVNPYGRIINLCSTRFLMSEPGSEAYVASKGGVFSLTHALAISLAELGITVNSISPGYITNGHNELHPETFTCHSLLHREGKPEDIARMCLFLCREENDFINGENITIDGGMSKSFYQP